MTKPQCLVTRSSPIALQASTSGCAPSSCPPSRIKPISSSASNASSNAPSFENMPNRTVTKNGCAFGRFKNKEKSTRLCRVLCFLLFDSQLHFLHATVHRCCTVGERKGIDCNAQGVDPFDKRLIKRNLLCGRFAGCNQGRSVNLFT